MDPRKTGLAAALRRLGHHRDATVGVGEMSLTEYSLTRSLLLWQTALHEWLGLLVYHLTR
jgi:hypothetical protein